jgi:hypothetical protein
MTDDTVAKIRLAIEEYDGFVTSAWSCADAPPTRFAYLPEDPDKLVEHHRKTSDLAAEFAGRCEGARRKLVEAIKTAIAEAAPSNKTWCQFFCAKFRCFDRDMTAFWKALKIVLSDYDAHRPDDRAELARHYEEKTLFSFEFVKQLERERVDLGCELEMEALGLHEPILVRTARPSPDDLRAPIS